MNEIRSIFLAVLKSALLGEQAQLNRDLLPDEWQQLFAMAETHRVLPLVFQAVYASPSLQGENAPLAAAVKRKVRQQVMWQTVKTSEFLALNRALRAAGIQPLVVKGIVCRNLYPQPDYRPSGDEDVLITAEQFDLCHQELLIFGMHTTAAPDKFAESYEIPYRKEGSPLYIELHKHLFPPESTAYGDLNRFFTAAQDRAITEDIQGTPVSTLGYTDHLFYLICHAFKHFLHSGFGIRQVCDIILFANRHGTEIDWVQVLKNCRAIRADRFAAAIFQIGSNYLCFDPEQAAWPQVWRDIAVDERAMLDDLLSGGLYGDAQMSRKHSSNITLSAISSQKQGRQAGRGVLSSVFPTARKLEQRYPYLKARPYLLPVAWGDRLLKYAWETRQIKNNTAADALKIGSDRIELMKQYGILSQRRNQK